MLVRIFILLLISLCSQPALAEPSIKNGGFETDLVGWDLTQNGGTVSLSTDDVLGGNSSVRFLAQGDESFLMVAQEVFIGPVRTGDAIEISASFKSTVEGEAPEFYVLGYSSGSAGEYPWASNTFIHLFNLRESGAEKNRVYTRFLVPDTTIKLYFGLRARNLSEIVIDDIRIKSLGSVTEVLSKPSSFAQEVLSLVTENSLHWDDKKHQWAKSQFIYDTVNAKTKDDELNAVTRFLKKLDRHSFIISSAGITEHMEQVELPSGKLNSGLLHLELPAILTENKKHIESYVTAYNGLYRDSEFCGVLIDLRKNSGGNMWPMLGALSPFLPYGRVGAFIDGKGNVTEWLNTRKGVYEGEELLQPHLVDTAPATFKDKPLAILTSRATMSSAEALLIALKSKPNVQVFGEKTGGFVDANYQYKLSTGEEMLLAHAWLADSDLKPQKKPISPDVLATDPVAPATEWLKAQCERRSRLASNML